MTVNLCTCQLLGGTHDTGVASPSTAPWSFNVIYKGDQKVSRAAVFKLYAQGFNIVFYYCYGQVLLSSICS